MSRLRLACGVLSLVLSGPLMAADLSSVSLIEKGALTYGVAGTFAPFEFQKDGKLSGFDIDLSGSSARSSGPRPSR
jgi:polar amino acid transport system substrate-binding protein